jgi:hypothetical protein
VIWTDVTLAKALKTVDGKRGVIRNPAVEIEQSVSNMQLDLLAQTTLVSDT